MNFFQLILKQMRQRSLSSWLTILSVMLGVALATAVIQARRGGEKLFGQSDFGYDLIVGAKGSKLQLVLNTVYGMDVSTGNVPWDVYSDLTTEQSSFIRWAVPFMVGDTWKSQRIMAIGGRFVDQPGLTELRDNTRALADNLKTLARPAPDETPEARAQRLRAMMSAADEAYVGLEDLIDQANAIDDSLAAPFRRAMEALVEAYRLAGARSPDELTRAAGQVFLAGDRLGGAVGQMVPFEYRRGRTVQLAEGRAFHPLKFEGVLGSEVARLLGMKLGDTFQLEHGGDATDVHEETWTVVGILQPTGTALDNSLYISLTSAWAVPEHSHALEAMAELDPDAEPEVLDPNDPHAGHDHDTTYRLRNGLIDLTLAESKWKVSGIFVQTRGGFQMTSLQWAINNAQRAMAVNPAGEMRSFFDRFLGPGTLLLGAIAIMVSAVAAVSILVSIYNSVVARRREIAILRALGATRSKVLAVITAEATLLGLVGGVLGVALGYLVATVATGLIDPRLVGDVEGITLGAVEFYYLIGVVIGSALAGLVPALKAYRVSVADNLSSAE